MAESLESLLQKTDDQIETSTELCIASHSTAMSTKKIIAGSRELIARSRAQLAGIEFRKRALKP